MRYAQAFVSKNFIYVALAALLFGFASYAAVYAIESTFTAVNWKLTQYHVSFVDFGFVRRGVVGTLFAPILGPLADGGMAEKLVIVSYDIGLFVVVIGLLNRGLDKALNGQTGLATLIRIVLVLSPVGAMQYAYDIGRYDHLNFLIVLLAYLAYRDRFFGVAGLALTLGVFNHEAIVFYAVPVFLAAALTRRESLRHVASLGLPVAVAATLVLAFGAAPANLEATLGADIADGAVVWSRGLFEYQLWLPRHHYLISAFYFLCPLVFLGWIYRTNGRKPDLIFLAACTPVCLFVFGVDYFRWCQLELVSVLLAVILLSLDTPLKLPDRVPTWAMIVAAAYCLPLGPVGIDIGLPYVGQALNLLGIPGFF